MKKFVDDIRLIYKCCSLYYEDDWKQQDIAEYLSISRASVSRMLQMGKEMGMVKVEICNPGLLTYDRMERQLERRLGLREVIIAEYQPFDNEEERTKRLSDKAMAYLCHTLKDGDMVGVSMGRTLHNITQCKRTTSTPIACTIVPVLGGLSRDNPFEVKIHSNQIAIRLAEAIGGNCIQFFSPAIFSDRAVLQGFLKEMPIQNQFRYFEKLTMVVMGIGESSVIGSTLVQTEYMTESEMEQMIKEGAVGDICLRFFDKDGNMDPFHRFNDRVASITPDSLRQIDKRVGVANGGNKARAALGAVRSGCVNVLIIDVDCAQRMMEILEEKEPEQA
ncbi:MAG: sugar-binding transcriptional regulator [Lachnospiraceae bacterium]|nr:sugar-binding transcriptional regulator [Lachnospiraceae bacterium]